MTDIASDRDLLQLAQAREQSLRNPYTAGRTGAGTLLGHTVGYVSPYVGDKIISGTAHVQNAADSIDIRAGKLLNKLGVPPSWTLTEEKVDVGDLPFGKPGIVPSKRMYVHRMTAPLSRAAALTSLAAMGLWAKDKLLPKHREEDNVRTAMSKNTLTPETHNNTLEARKLAAHVIDAQADAINELHGSVTKLATYVAALSQAVKMAQDGLIDVSDIQENAKRLSHSSSVKLSAADDVFHLTPGETQTRLSSSSDSETSLDPLTSQLRSRI